MNRRGFGLVTLIFLMGVFAVLFASTSFLFTNAARDVQLTIDKMKAHYLAQAGIKRAFHNWLVSSPTDTSRRYRNLNTTVTKNQIFKMGCEANYAYFTFNESGSTGSADWTVVSGRPRLRRWAVRNIRMSESIKFVGIRVRWDAVGELTSLRSVSMDGTDVLSAGAYANNVEIPLTRTFELTAGSRAGGSSTFLEWTGVQPACVKVDVQWRLNDDSPTKDSKTHEVLYWNGVTTGNPPPGRPANRSFCITATGQVNQTSSAGGRLAFKVLKTVKATILRTPADTFLINDWDEVDKNIP